MSLTHALLFLMCHCFWAEQSTALRQYRSTGARIVGGHEVEPHSIPYQAFLNVTGTNGDTWICGGSLISQNYVLTAGRCCFGAKSVTVVLGAHDLKEKNIYQVTLKSTNFTVNAKFNNNVLDFVYVEDIAVVALPKPVKLHDFLKPARLPNPYEWNTFENRTGRISGWGLTDGYNQTSYSQVLLAQETRIMGSSECMNSYLDLHNYDICVQVNETDSPCIGDYGSPLTVDDVQVGIASQGYDNCDPFKPFIYSRISDFLTWIKANTDYQDDYTTQSTTEATTKVTKSTITAKKTTTGYRTTTDSTSTTTGTATRSNCLGVLLLLKLSIILTQIIY